jgi:putative methyltransferase (TIGR04325 family)
MLLKKLYEIMSKILKKLIYLVFIINYKLFFQKKKEGYNNLALNKSVIKKTILFSKIKLINENDINYKRTVDFLEFIKKKKLKTILDFGGGAGYHYLIARIKLPNFSFKWLIVENRTMVRLCIKQLKYKNLFFSNSLNKIKTDIFFSSCAINYTKNPTETIKSIIKLKTKYLYFTRTPLTENQSLEFKQFSLLSDNGPCKINSEKEMLINYDNKIINRQKFEDMFKNKFIIIEKYVDEKKAFFYKNRFISSYTYIFKKIV